MITVRDILERKGHAVVSVGPHDTVLETAERMNKKRIGAVVVLEPDRGVAGIFTERDILRRVVAERKSPDTTRVGDVMSHPVTCCKPATTLNECQSVMTSKHLRHLPVVDKGRLVGMISIGDILAQEVQVQQTTIDYLHDYLYGRT